MTQVWYPSLEDVAALLRARTKSRMGGEVGMFTADTRPTDIEVRRLMAFAAVDMAPCIGDPDTLPVKYHESLSLVVAMKTAMLIELSYFPEQVAQDRSAYAEYETMHTYMKEALCSSIGDDPSVTGTSQDIPTGDFPGYGWVWLNVGDIAGVGVTGNDGSIWTLNDVIRRLEGTGG